MGDRTATTTREADHVQLPVFDLTPYLAGGDDGRPAAQSGQSGQSEQSGQLTPAHEEAVRSQLCREVAACFKHTGALVVRDPRVDSRHNARFLDVMEAYFSQPVEQKMKDARPHLHYQVGITPEGIERPRCLNDPAIRGIISALGEVDGGRNAPRPPHGPDPKWRYFWRLGERPTQTRFQELNAVRRVDTAARSPRLLVTHSCATRS